MPVFNAAATVEAAVRSVLAQTFTDFELVCVDDGSTDGSAAVLQRLAGEDSRVRWVSQPHGGQVAAAVRTLEEASGRDFVARMDADDLCLPERLRLSVAALDAEPSLSAVGTGVEIFRGDQPVSPNLQGYARWLSSLTTPEALFRDRFVESPLCNPSITFRRTAIADAGWYREGPFPEDWELLLRLLSRGHRLRALDSVQLRWRDHPHRVTRNDSRYAWERHLDLKADHLATWLADKQPLTVWGAGETGLKLGRRLTERGRPPLRYVELSAKKIGQKIDGVPVVAPSVLDSGPAQTHVLAAVSAQGARAEIRDFLEARGFEENRDFTCAG